MPTCTVHLHKLSGDAICDLNAGPETSWGDVRLEVAGQQGIHPLSIKLVVDNAEVDYMRIVDANGQTGHAKAVLMRTPLPLVCEILDQYERLGHNIGLDAVQELARLGPLASAAAPFLCDLLANAASDDDGSDEDDDDRNEEDESDDTEDDREGDDSDDDMPRLAPLRVRAAAARALGHILAGDLRGGEDGIAALVAAVSHDSDFRVSHAAADALALLALGSSREDAEWLVDRLCFVGAGHPPSPGSALDLAVRLSAEAAQVPRFKDDCIFAAPWDQEAACSRRVEVLREQRKRWQITRAALSHNQAIALDMQLEELIPRQDWRRHQHPRLVFDAERLRAVQGLVDQGASVARFYIWNPGDRMLKCRTWCNGEHGHDYGPESLLANMMQSLLGLCDYPPQPQDVDLLRTVIVSLGLTDDLWVESYLFPDDFAESVSRAVVFAAAGVRERKDFCAAVCENAQILLELIFVMCRKYSMFCEVAEALVSREQLSALVSGLAVEPEIVTRAVRFCCQRHPSLCTSSSAWHFAGPWRRIEELRLASDAVGLLPRKFGEDQTVRLPSTPLSSERFRWNVRDAVVKLPGDDLLACLNFCRSGRTRRLLVFSPPCQGLFRELVRRRERWLLEKVIRDCGELRNDSATCRITLLLCRGCRGKKERVEELLLQLWSFAVWKGKLARPELVQLPKSMP